ncbi:hypothetical protein [Comamonas composti]|uniref:hypothetical protein n=1 Tax=Comamonas composti TaxID=408558 RepID=UPI00146FBDF5|nr:hypothetical protein [Comamonas composti]
MQKLEWGIDHQKGSAHQFASLPVFLRVNWGIMIFIGIFQQWKSQIFIFHSFPINYPLISTPKMEIAF